MSTVQQWVHLDLKGIIPSEAKLVEWLERLKAWGFSGVVFEYEDRLPWQSLPGTFRPGYTSESWKRIWAECERIGLEVVPLIQTFGHLEWLLKHERYAHLREAGFWNLLCPLHPEAMPLLARWLDEVIALHPRSRHIHVGLDEVHHLASCPRCRQATEASKEGVLAVYQRHATAICEHVLARGLKPLVWGDMYVNHRRPDLARQLPDGAMICDWGYSSAEPGDTTGVLASSGRPLIGTSAIRCGFDPPYELQAPLGERLVNVRGWHRLAVERGIPILIHTVWGRSRSLLPLYGPWEGWLPAFIAAGDPQAKLGAAMTAAIEHVDAGLSAVLFQPVLKAAAAIRELRSDDPFERQALRWWDIALRHRHELWWAEKPLGIGSLSMEAMRGHVGVDPDITALKQQERRTCLANLAGLEDEIRAFWRDNQLSDEAELLATHLDSVRRCLLLQG
ncbi:MAG: family 20 glycosylhydrolase [Planctomycetes bacterium]|nr:family 20 glycosylhydrolase [Planctomycetota bacterium]